MSKLTLKEFIEATENGKVFTVEFVKRTNNELRKMNCRRGVTKGVKGVGLSYNPAEKNLLGVYDMQAIESGKDEKGAFRMINLESLKTLKLGGKAYDWNNESKEFVEV